MTGSGQSALDAGNFDQAIEDFEAAIEAILLLDAYFGLGNAYTRQGKLGEPWAAYEKALEINPNHWPHCRISASSITSKEV